MPKPDREQILAFRLTGHNLTRRLGPRSVTKAAAACGVQETPMGSAAIAFLARVEKLTPALLDRALFEDRTLVSLWAMRGAPYVVPARDLEVHRGSPPARRGVFKQSLGGWSDALEKVGLDPFETLERMASAAQTLLDGRTLNVKPGSPRNEENVTMLRGFATINYWAADLTAAREWYSELLGIEPTLNAPSSMAASSARMTLTITGPASDMSSSASATTSTSWD